MARKKQTEAITEAVGGKHQELSFEAALERLESIVRQLEMDNPSLEQALALFQEGVGLSRYSQLKLAESEAQIDLLINNKDGKLELKPAALNEKFSKGE